MDTDRNLLFGVLALQADAITPSQFVEACTLWAARKTEPLADLLVGHGWMAPEARSHVDYLLGLKLRKYGNDARAALAETAGEEARQSLAALSDADIQHSLAESPPGNGPIAAATLAYQPEQRERYTLSRLHGQGGIGRVWLARDHTVGRDVALKELRPERAAHAAIRERFLEEAKVTGQLEHPGIVPVYELAQRPEDGQPFYTMRFVRGRTLADATKEYHRKRSGGEAGSLELRELLGAFVAVCNAVAYAHSRGVLHRDIKGSNVVLGRYGEVVVLDWGLAKLVGAAEAAASLLPVAVDEEREGTQQGQVVGTPGYMAPEQAAGRSDQIGERSDVYGLGALLYEILTGRPPFAGSQTHEVIRRVLEEKPERPGKVVAGTPVALEAVCLKALAKRPEARYGSAKELAGEVQQWLADEPVAAYPEPPRLRLARWGRRHRTLVSAAAVLLLASLAATVMGLVLLGRKNEEIAAKNAEVTAERNAAQEAAAEAQAINEFLTDDLLGQASPDVNSRDRNITVEELLHRAARQIEGNAKFAGHPEVQARLRLTIGETYFMLGNLPEAEKHKRRAMELCREAFGPEDPRTLAAQEALADFLNLGPGRFLEAEELARQTWQARARVLGPEHRDTLNSLDTYAISLLLSGRAAQAITRLRECLAARQSVLGPDDPDTNISMNNLARALSEQEGEWAEAIRLLHKGLDTLGQRRQGAGYGYAMTASNLAAALYLKGDLMEAEKLLQENLDRSIRQFGADHPLTDRCRGLLVRVWTDQGRLKEAVPLGREVVAFRRRASLNPALLGSALVDLGRALVLLGRATEAEPVLAEARRTYIQVPSSPHYYTAWAECWHGASLAGQGNYKDAGERLLAAEPKLRDDASCPRRHYRQAVEQFIKLYEAQKKPDEADKWRKVLQGIDGGAPGG